MSPEIRNAALIRVFSPDTSKVEGSVRNMVETLERIFAHDGMPIHHAFVLIPTDDRFGDSDCGETAGALRDALQGHLAQDQTTVVEVKQGDIFVGVLNRGIAEALAKGMTHATVISWGVRSYITRENLDAMMEAHRNGALASGLAIQELRDSISDGRLANTFASWDLKALVSVGAFDLRSAKPRKDDRFARYVQGEEGTSYHLAGVEEILPLLRLVRLHGRCIAPIVPSADAGWQLPADEEGLARHKKKIGTKFVRQHEFAKLEEGDLHELRDGVAPGYPLILEGVTAGV